MSVNIQIGASLDTANLQQQLADLTRQINAAGQAIARAGGQRFQPITQADVQMAQRIETTMRSISKLAPDLYRRIKATGQQNTPWHDLDWGQLYSSPQSALRAQRGLFTMATGLQFGAAPAPPPMAPVSPPPPPRPAPPAPPPRPGLPSRLTDTALTHMGPMGGAAARGIGQGRAAYHQAGGGLPGIGAGFLGGIGGALGFGAVAGVGALVGMVRQRIDTAQQESIGYADLYRALGGRGSRNTQGGLQARGRDMSFGIDVPYDEALALLGLAARRGGSTGAEALAAEVTAAGGFARSFGFDPGAGVAAFSGLRGSKVVNGADEMRRLGVQIAEGIARAGVFAKAEEYLSEIAAYGERTTEATVTRANVEDFNAALSRLAGSGLPGMTVHGAAALLGQADSAIRRGGAAGEAGQNLMYAIGRRQLGLDPMGTELFQEGGAFATGRNTFGVDAQGRRGIVGDFYRANGIPIPEGTAEDDRTAFDLVMAELDQQFSGDRRRLLPNAAAQMLGISQRQVLALRVLTPGQRSRMGGLLSEEQLRNLNATGISTVGRIAGAQSAEELAPIITEFRGRRGRDELDPQEREALRQAEEGGDLEELKKVTAGIAAAREAENTQGNQIRRGIQGVEKAITDAASHLLDPLNTMRTAMLAMAGYTQRGAAQRLRDLELEEIDTQEKADLADIKRQREEIATRLQEAITTNPGTAMTPEQRAAARATEQELLAQDRRLREQEAAIRGRHNATRGEIRRRFEATTAPRPEVDTGNRTPTRGQNELRGDDRAEAERFLDDTDRRLGMPLGTSRAQIRQESGFRTDSVSRAGAQGIAQFMPDTVASINRRRAAAGQRPLDPMDWRDGLELHRILMEENIRRFGNTPDALRAYNAGPDRGRWNNPETQAYVPAIEAHRARGAGTPMPAGAPPGAVAEAGRPMDVRLSLSSADVNSTVTIVDPMGRPLAPPQRAQVPLRGVFDARPFGANPHGMRGG